MRLNEVMKQLDLSRRAIKFYEEKGLLSVAKDTNGYRNYTEENMETLKRISIYRKLDIGLPEIKILLHSEDTALLKDIYDKKKKDLEGKQAQLDAFEKLLSGEDINTVYPMVDYETVAKALQDNIPGAAGEVFMYHFLPYLQIPLTTEEQKKAYHAIIHFWDTSRIKLPLLIRISGFIIKRYGKMDMKAFTEKTDEATKALINMDDKAYEVYKQNFIKRIKRRKNPLVKYNLNFLLQRKLMRQLKDCGYNDIFISNMKKLSPSYKAYHDALMSLNNRVCAELGLYYDSNYHLVMKK